MEFTVSKGSCGREVLYEFETLCHAYRVLTGVDYVPKKGGPSYLRSNISVGSQKSKASSGSIRSTSTRSSRFEKKKLEKLSTSQNNTSREEEKEINGERKGEEAEEEEEEEIRGNHLNLSNQFFFKLVF